MRHLMSVRFILILSSLLAGRLVAQPQSISSKNSAKKSDAFSPERFRPDAEVPINPERFVWKLSTKRSTLAKNSDEVPVYAFDSDFGRPFAVGSVKVGEVITLDEFRLDARRNYYRYPWEKNATTKVPLSRSATFWIDGINIDYAGKK